MFDHRLDTIIKGITGLEKKMENIFTETWITGKNTKIIVSDI